MLTDTIVIIVGTALWVSFYMYLYSWQFQGRDFELAPLPQAGPFLDRAGRSPTKNIPDKRLYVEWIEQQPSQRTVRQQREYEHIRESLPQVGAVVIGIVLTILAVSFWENGWSLFRLEGGWPTFFMHRLGGTIVWGPILGVFLGGALVLGSISEAANDTHPITLAVRRVAWIENNDDILYFVVMSGYPTSDQMRLDVYMPWSDVNQFNHTDYWRTFGDTGASMVKIGWNAVSMSPSNGEPWLISSTIEGEGRIFDRVSRLNALFNASARSAFQQEKSRSGIPSRPVIDVPETLD